MAIRMQAHHDVPPEGPLSHATEDGQLLLEYYETAPEPLREHLVALLIGRLFRDAPPEQRLRIVHHLIRPLGVLSLMVIANGAFADFAPSLETGHDDPGAVRAVRGTDVVALVDFVQQVSGECVEGLYSLLSSDTPAFTTVAATLLLVILRMRRSGRATTRNAGSSTAAAP